MAFELNDTRFRGISFVCHNFRIAVIATIAEYYQRKIYCWLSLGEFYFPESRELQSLGELCGAEQIRTPKRCCSLQEILHRRKFPLCRRKAAVQTALGRFTGNLNRGGEDGVAKQPEPGLVRQAK